MKVNWIYKILLVGNNGSGKSTFVNYDRNNEKFFKDFSDNIGLDFFIKKIPVQNDLHCQLQIWDVNVIEHFYFLIPSYFRGTAMFLLFFDLSDRQTFYDLPIWVDIIEAFSDEIPILLIGSKSDLPTEVSYNEIQNFSRAHNLIGPYFISTEQGFRIDVIFSKIAEVLTGIRILSEEEKYYLKYHLGRFEDAQDFELSPGISGVSHEQHVLCTSHSNEFTISEQQNNSLLHLRDIMRGEIDFQGISKVELTPKEKKELIEFLEYFKYCPVCHVKNHKTYLKRFYLSKEKAKVRFKKRLLELMRESRYFKKRYYNTIKLGIPCCECFEKYCKIAKIEHN
ncbi:MAG: hypothetical protein BAJALOKI1v1_1660003 [Promethearchaeota archaeon]|nr:MAG: hypothetical protein BAJALOKI1v1_1660003 [Candidatus Lokiarchaeota archaeon]